MCFFWKYQIYPNPESFAHAPTLMVPILFPVNIFPLPSSINVLEFKGKNNVVAFYLDKYCKKKLVDPTPWKLKMPFSICYQGSHHQIDF